MHLKTELWDFVLFQLLNRYRTIGSWIKVQISKTPIHIVEILHNEFRKWQTYYCHFIFSFSKFVDYGLEKLFLGSYLLNWFLLVYFIFNRDYWDIKNACCLGQAVSYSSKLWAHAVDIGGINPFNFLNYSSERQFIKKSPKRHVVSHDPFYAVVFSQHVGLVGVLDPLAVRGPLYDYFSQKGAQPNSWVVYKKRQ